MNILSVVSLGLKLMFERVGRPKVFNRPELLRSGGGGAVIACNHVGWADGLWMAYALYPRQLRFISKQELFAPVVSRWVLLQSGSVPIDRSSPSTSSIKTAVDIVRKGELILVFPSGTRSKENIAFKRGAATIALHARVPLVPAFLQSPGYIQASHLLRRPSIEVIFGLPIPTATLPLDRATAIGLTRQLQVAIGEIQSEENSKRLAA